MKGYYLNEPIEVVEELEEDYRIRFDHDGFEEVVPKEEVFVFRDNGLKKSRINPYNKERRKKKFKRNFGSKERVEAVKGKECVVPNCNIKNCHNAHVKARGMGGSGGSKDNIVPLCPKHHREQGNIGIESFEAKYNLDLSLEAEIIANELKDLS